MKKILLYIICLCFSIASSIALGGEVKFPNKFNQCKLTRSALNNYEPEEFQVSNNLLRKSGQAPIYSGTKIIVKGRLLDQNCVPVSDAKIYLWQVGSDGKYPYKPLRNKVSSKLLNLKAKSTFTGSGTATTNNKGEFYFITLYPGKNINQAANVNIRVEHRDLGNLQTRLHLTSNIVNSENCGEINHSLASIPLDVNMYDFDIVMRGRTLRKY